MTTKKEKTLINFINFGPVLKTRANIIYEEIKSLRKQILNRKVIY